MWVITVLLPALLAFGALRAAVHFNVLLGLVFDVAVLYLTLGFRQFSHYFTDIRDALERGDEAERAAAARASGAISTRASCRAPNCCAT